MNILVISSIYPEPKHYGIGNDTMVVHYFTKYWAERGHRVIVIHPHYNAIKNIKHFTSKYAHIITHTIIDNVTVIYGETQLYIPHSLSPARWRDARFAKRMRKYMELKFPDFTPDCVSVHFPIILQNFIPSFLNGENALAVFHGTDIRLLQSLKNRQAYIQKLDKLYKSFLFRSPKLLSTGIECGINPQKSKILISGLKQSLIADRKFIDNKIRRDFSKIRLLYAGKLVRQKRIDQIIKALSLVGDVIDYHFDLVGDGPELSKLKKMADELGIGRHITFHGQMARTEVSNMMGKADIFIMTSSNETLGLVYLEAMAQGCIAIGSKGEGIDGIIIDNDNGFLVNPNNVNEIADCIECVSNIDKGAKSIIINKAYDTVSNLTDSVLSERYCSILEQISLS